ncbi:MAG: DsbA family protein [Nitrospirota bacterium]|nr:DsbA family protein [Nitrospirota bacterium]
MNGRPLRLGLTIGFALFVSLFGSANMAFSAIQGEYELIEGEPSLHESGKVILLEFADFYCPHCHMFERVVVTKLQKEFGDKLETRMIGFPVMPGKLPTVFEMYNQAVTMGKGQRMKEVLFQSIHDKDIQMFDKTMRALILKEVDLDPKAFEAGLATGKPFQTLGKGKEWGERIKVTHTPTVVLDGNIRIQNLNFDNLKIVIQSILDQD